MGFFDLNIPYLEHTPPCSAAQKANRVKTVIKAMELGFTGAAYNRTIKGVMSDRDRCSISILTLSTLLKLAPSISSSVEFHRDLIGVPRASPFRQYTRITVCVDSPAQSQALNSGNPILKSYDIVAVRPLNQTAFDHACEKANVDIISIGFADKLPFRLKQHMIKAAIERGVYFELVYSDLIMDVQLRRQMISNAKLLVVWARGKNLIISSAAPSVCELRGPNDVANLVSLLGLSPEHAKAAISKNCRNLISNALRRKYFYKEAIRVEQVSFAEPSVSDKSWSAELFKWDPLSSGEGDLQLNDMATAFLSPQKVSDVVKAIDFDSVIDTMTSHGFQVSNFSGADELPQSFGNRLFSTTEAETEAGSKFGHLSGTDDALFGNTQPDNQSLACDDSQEVNLVPKNLKHFAVADEVNTQPVTMENESMSKEGLDILASVERHDLINEIGISGYEKNEALPVETRDDDEANSEFMLDTNVSSQALDKCIELDENFKAECTSEVSVPSHEDCLPVSLTKEVVNNIEVGSVAVNDRGVSFTTDMEIEQLRSATGCSLGIRSNFRPADITVVSHPTSPMKSKDEIKMTNDSTVAITEAKVSPMITDQEMDSNLTSPSSILIGPLTGSSLERAAASVNKNVSFLADAVPVVEFDTPMNAKDDSSASNYEAHDEALSEVPNHEGHRAETVDPSGVEYLSDFKAGRASLRHKRSNQVHLRPPFMRFLRPRSSKKKVKVQRCS